MSILRHPALGAVLLASLVGCRTTCVCNCLVPPATQPTVITGISCQSATQVQTAVRDTCEDTLDGAVLGTINCTSEFYPSCYFGDPTVATQIAPVPDATVPPQ